MRFLFYQKISTDLSEAEWEVREHLISCQNKETEFSSKFVLLSWITKKQTTCIFLQKNYCSTANLLRINDKY